MRIVKQANGGYAVAFKDPNVTRGNPWRTISLRTKDEREAQANLQEWLTEQNKQQAKHNTIGDLWELFLPTIQGKPSLRARQTYWRTLSSYFTTVVPINIEETVASYTSGRRSSGISNGSIRSELKLLRTLLNWSVKKGYLDRAPHIPLPQAPPPKDLYLTRQQFRTLLSAAEHRHLELFLVLAVTTAARMGALLELTWDRVDFDRKQINLRTEVQQARKGRAIVPMNASALRVLQVAQEKATTGFVIEWGGQRVQSIHGGLKTAAAKAGMPWVSAHILRHTAAVWMAEAGVPMSEISQYLGHTSTIVTERVYARFSPTYLAKAASALEIDT